jgi:hypothetical protein
MKPTDWNLPTEGLQSNMVIYLVSKTLINKALWKFTEEYGELDIVTGE